MTHTEELIQTIKRLLPQTDNSIALHEPSFLGNEWKYVKECLDTGWVSSVGKFVDRFENEIAHFTGAKYAIATSNGTSALHICYLLAGIKPGDEVLIPAMTFVATANAISYCGAQPHFIESEESHLGIDAKKLDDYLDSICKITNEKCINKLTGKTIRALCVMHTLGHPVDLDALEEICNKYHLVLLEDAAEALGSYYKGIHVGHRGLLGALSFNGNKIITTGGGGAILTNNVELAKKAKHLTTTAKIMHPWLFEHNQVAYNYRLPNINAAIGCAQLELLPDFLKRKRFLAEQYEEKLSKFNYVKFLKEPSYGKSNYWLNAILLNQNYINQRDVCLDLFLKNGLMVRPLWNLLHTLPMYSQCSRMPLTVAENLQKQLIKIPSSPNLIKFY